MLFQYLLAVFSGAILYLLPVIFLRLLINEAFSRGFALLSSFIVLAIMVVAVYLSTSAIWVGLLGFILAIVVRAVIQKRKRPEFIVASSPESPALLAELARLEQHARAGTLNTFERVSLGQTEDKKEILHPLEALKQNKDNPSK